MKINNNIYINPQSVNFFNSDKTICLTIEEWRKINLKKYHPTAIKNLMATIQDKDLSLGDKIIIKNIALDSFNWMINFATTEKGGQNYGLYDCIRTDLYEFATHRLRDFGFKVKHPHSRIKDFDFKK